MNQRNACLIFCIVLVAGVIMSVGIENVISSQGNTGKGELKDKPLILMPGEEYSWNKIEYKTDWKEGSGDGFDVTEALDWLMNDPGSDFSKLNWTGWKQSGGWSDNNESASVAVKDAAWMSDTYTLTIEVFKKSDDTELVALETVVNNTDFGKIKAETKYQVKGTADRDFENASECKAEAKLAFESPSFKFTAPADEGNYYIKITFAVEESGLELGDATIPIKVLDDPAASGGLDVRIEVDLPGRGYYQGGEVVTATISFYDKNGVEYGNSNEYFLEKLELYFSGPRQDYTGYVVKEAVVGSLNDDTPFPYSKEITLAGDVEPGTYTILVKAKRLWDKGYEDIFMSNFQVGQVEETFLSPLSCNDCHDTPSKHGAVGVEECGPCHTEELSVPLYDIGHETSHSFLEKPTCDNCHTDSVGNDVAATTICSSCHYSDSAIEHFDDNTDDECGSCHGIGEIKAIDLVHEYEFEESHYVGVDTCRQCHDHEGNPDYSGWKETDHGKDFTNYDLDGQTVNLISMDEGACTVCHVVGFDQTDIGGFDPAMEWNTSHNLGLNGIQCESCHGPGSEHAISGNTSPLVTIPTVEATCIGVDGEGCHGGTRQYETDIVQAWSSSAHAPFDNRAQEAPGGLNTYCAECKSPSQFVEGSSYGSSDPVPKEEWNGIRCGDCHVVESHEYQMKFDVVDACDTCHNGGHHETMRTVELAGEPSIARADYPYMNDVSCIDCHMWSSPSALTGTPYEHSGHTFSPTVDACIECHTDIFDNIPDKDDTVNWTAWEQEYLATLDEWGEINEASQSRFDGLLERVTHVVEEVEEIIEQAEGNGTWTPEIEAMWVQAEYDWELADHASRGAHNPAYATALLIAAEESLEEILGELSVGLLNGFVTDSMDNPIGGAFIYANGIGTRTAGDGTYSLVLVPGTYLVTVYKMGSIDQSVSGLVLAAAEVVVQNFTMAEDLDHDGTPDSIDTDDDNDGMPDVWESNNSLDPRDPSDSDADPDDDGYTNLQEYVDDTDPQVKNIAQEPPDPEEPEEADTTIYMVTIIVLIIIIVLLGVMMVMKGDGKPVHQEDIGEPTEPAEEPEQPDEEES